MPSPVLAAKDRKHESRSLSSRGPRVVIKQTCRISLSSVITGLGVSRGECLTRGGGDKVVRGSFLEEVGPHPTSFSVCVSPTIGMDVP